MSELRKFGGRGLGFSSHFSILLPMSDFPIHSLDPALAAAIHEHYRAQAKVEGWTLNHDVPYADLPPDLQNSNLVAARRIPEVLAVAGLRIVSGDVEALSDTDALAVQEEHIEAAAITEHEGWI